MRGDAINLAGSSVENTDLGGIAKLRNLEKLNLSGTAIGDAGIEHIRGHSAVQFLDISRTSVSSHCLKSIATLSQLKKLVVDPSLSDEGTIQELKDRGVTVEVLPASQDEMTRHWANWK